MSYDLTFYTKENDMRSPEKIKEFFTDRKHFNIKPLENRNYQFWYENEDTGVYFTFDLSYDTSNEDESGNMDGYRASGLSFNINYMRPSFFAYEAMPIVQEITEQLDLFVCDPQDHDNTESIPKKYSSEELINSWSKSNKWATGIYKEKGAKLYYLDSDVSKLTWQYLMKKDELQEKLGDTTFVPKIFIIRFKESATLYTAITWSQSISEVIPKCDYVLIMQEKSKWFGLGKTSNKAVIPYNQVVEKLTPFIEPFDFVIPDTKILKPERQFDALPQFNKLEGLNFDKVEILNVESYIDFKL